MPKVDKVTKLITKSEKKHERPFQETVLLNVRSLKRYLNDPLRNIQKVKKYQIFWTFLTIQMFFCKNIKYVRIIYQHFSTGGPRYLQTIYLQICIFTLAKLVQNAYFLVKNRLFNCKFMICGAKWQNVSIANNEGNLSNSMVLKSKNLTSEL